MESSRGQSKESQGGKSKRKKRKEKKQEEKKKKRKPKKNRMMEVKKVAEKWEIWNKKEETAKSEEEVKKLVSEKFHKWIYVFGKKASERMPMRKLWDHAIETKERFMLRKGKVYLLSREEREEVHEFIQEQLEKEYIKSSKLSQIAFVFFVGRRIIRNI